MLLYEVPTKTVRHLRKKVTEMDIPGIPATIALHGLMKAFARQIRWTAVERNGAPLGQTDSDGRAGASGGR
jgi:hypothetical protein